MRLISIPKTIQKNAFSHLTLMADVYRFQLAMNRFAIIVTVTGVLGVGVLCLVPPGFVTVEARLN